GSLLLLDHDSTDIAFGNQLLRLVQQLPAFDLDRFPPGMLAHIAPFVAESLCQLVTRIVSYRYKHKTRFKPERRTPCSAFLLLALCFWRCLPWRSQLIRRRTTIIRRTLANTERLHGKQELRKAMEW